MLNNQFAGSGLGGGVAYLIEVDAVGKVVGDYGGGFICALRCSDEYVEERESKMLFSCHIRGVNIFS